MMSEWDVVSEKPASSNDWSVASEKPVEKKEAPSLIQRWMEPRGGEPEEKRPPSNIKPPPVEDELKSLRSGMLEGGVYAVPGVGQAIGGFDLGRALATGANNLVSNNKLPQPPSVASQIVGALGLEHDPETMQGRVMKVMGGAAPVAEIGNVASTAGKGAEILSSVSNRIKEGAQFKPLTVVNADTKAAEAIVKNLQELHKAGGEAPEQVVRMIKEARAEGTPLSFADVGEQNKRLAGTVYRKGGTSREFIQQQLLARDAAAQARLDKSLGSYLGSGSVRQTTEDLAIVRSAAGRPVFEEAMRGGSLAPLEAQYQDAFSQASKNVAQHSDEVNKLLNKTTQLKAKLATNKDVYVGAETAKELKNIEGQLHVKEIELKQASSDKEAVLEHLRTAQKDRLTAAPGAVWSPQIQRLSQNPIIKTGLNRGMQIERNLADAEGRVFDPTEYAAVKGAKDEYEIAKVPNMRVLAVAKEGLDNMLSDASLRDPVTRRLTKEGLSIQKLRDSLVSELDRLNPKYKEARDVWAGDSAKINALGFGENAFGQKPEEIAHALSKMSESEKEFARMGLAEKMREQLLKTRVNGDEAKKLLNNEWTKQQIRPFFKSEKDFNAFVKDVSAERTMFETGVNIARNSLTADRQAADMADKLQTGVQATRGLYDLASGAFRNAAHTAISLWQKSKLWDNPEYNEAIARLMFDPNADFSKVEALIEKAPKK